MAGQLRDLDRAGGLPGGKYGSALIRMAIGYQSSNRSDPVAVSTDFYPHAVGAISLLTL
jgi:hypothetical protein